MATNIHSVNLDSRNEQVYKRYFGRKGRGGEFSGWLNQQMYKYFRLNSLEAIDKLISDKNKEICALLEKRKAIVLAENKSLEATKAA
jgi:hypothetical protein